MMSTFNTIQKARKLIQEYIEENIEDLGKLKSGTLAVECVINDLGIVDNPTLIEVARLAYNEAIVKQKDKPKEEETEVEFAEREIHNRILGEKSIIKSGSPEVKMFIRTLSKVKLDEQTGKPLIEGGKVIIERDENGLPVPVDFSKIYMKILELFNGTYNTEEIMRMMDNESLQSRLPEIALIAERLNTISHEDFSGVSFLNGLYTAIGSPTFVFVYTLKQYEDEKGKRFILTEEIRKKRNEKAWNLLG